MGGGREWKRRGGTGPAVAAPRPLAVCGHRADPKAECHPPSLVPGVPGGQGALTSPAVAGNSTKSDEEGAAPAMPRHVYFQREAPDPVLPSAAVLSLVRRHVPGAAAVAGVDESGGEARTYAVDADIILKVQRPQQLRTGTSLEREVVFLRHLETAAPDLAVPRVLGYGHDGPELEYTVLSRMPGVAMGRAALGPAARRRLLLELGPLLRRVHGIPQSPLQDSGLFPGDRGLPDLQARFGEAFLALAERLERERRAWPFPLPPERIGVRVMGGLPRGGPLVALHSNPGPTHTFVDPETGRFSGVIDFGDAYISHPALDLRRWAGPSDRDAILAGYSAAGPVDEGFLAVWRAVLILSAAQVLVSGGDGAAAAAEDLGRLLAEA